MQMNIKMRMLRTAIFASCIAGVAGGAAFAEPIGGVIAAGTGVVNPEIGQTTTIDQTSGRLIVDWQSFGVSANERVEFNQPNADAIALNRILSGAPSMIAGQITANGRVFLLNADGIVFTSTANIDVNSLLATTMDIANADFMADNFVFDQPGTVGAAIVNEGAINAASAGLIAFVAPNVENAGLLRANLGKVVLASGEAFTLDFFGDNLVAFAASAASGAKTGSINVSGDIEAPDGSIILTASAARDFINTVINVESDLVADSASMVGGKIILSGGENSEINIAGDLEATGRDGGEIDIEGGVVAIASTARLLADADQGMGDGGAIRVNSFERTDFAGLASVEPGASSGQGGDIAITSDGLVIFSGIARAGAPPRAGTITIGSNSTGGSTGGGGTGGGTGGGSTGGGSTGGGGAVGGLPDTGAIDAGAAPIIILPPAVDDRAADAISEVAATTPVTPYEPGTPEGPSASSAVVVFGESIVFDFSADTDNNPADETSDQLLCLNGVSEAACGDRSE